MLLFRRRNSDSALARRFTQILDEKLDSATKSMVHSDPQLQSLYDKHMQNQYKEVYHRELSYLKAENVLKHHKQGADIARAQPWTGTESTHDSTLRMLVDAKPKAKMAASSTHRLAAAKETTLDYKLLKGTDTERQKFRETYKEKLLGPSMLLTSGLGTIDLVNSVASAKINASINVATGKFDDKSMDSVRGKPLSAEILKNAGSSDFFMNKILNTQEVLPPWIESQQNMTSEQNGFRAKLDDMVFRHLIRDVPNDSTKIQAIEHVMRSKESKLASFKQTNKDYIDEKIKLLNNSIRSYNLQCPSTNLHRFKLNPDKEISDSFARVDHKLSDLIEAWVDKNHNPAPPDTKFIGLFDTRVVAVRQRKVEKIPLWQSFKQMFQEI